MFVTRWLNIVYSWYCSILMFSLECNPLNTRKLIQNVFFLCKAKNWEVYCHIIDKNSISPFQLKKAHSSRVEIIKQCLLHNNTKLNDLQVQRDSSPDDLEVMKLVRRRQIIVSDFSYFSGFPIFLILICFSSRYVSFNLNYLKKKSSGTQVWR